jgi:ABC-2 type transport system ATP-binding protein
MKEIDAVAPPPAQDAARPPGEPVIVAQGLRREFGREVALDHLDLSVARGTIYGFIGPSGSGKTTAVRLLAGIDVPTQGEVTVLGTPTGRFDGDLRARIGYLPQNVVQFPNLTVDANLRFTASLYGMRLRGRRRAIKQVLTRTELYDHRHKSVRKLSGGMARRLALSAALLHDPEILFLDEPTAGVDPVLRRKLWNHFEELRQAGRTLFVTTQYVGEATYCDRVGVLAEGRLIAEGTPAELRRRAMGGDVVDFRPSEGYDGSLVARLCDVPGVHDVQTVGGSVLRMVVDDASRRLPEIHEWCRSNNIGVESLQEVSPPFDDVFAALMQRDPDPATAPGAAR